jgi:hypothetical protein
MANEHQGLAAADFPEAWQPVEDPSFQINVNIHIACDDPAEVSKHLYSIADQYRVLMRKTRGAIPPPGADGTNHVKLLDNNCYGTHAVDINFDTQPSDK